MNNKPKAKVIGENGNVFNLLGICTKALRANNQAAQAKEMSAKIFTCGSYDEALQMMSEYVEFE